MGEDKVCREAAGRRRAVVMAGHRGEIALVQAARDDPDPAVRAARLGALARMGSLSIGELTAAFSDPHQTVRRRAAIEAVHFVGPGSRSKLPALLLGALCDEDPLVGEAAAWALGERRVVGSVDALAAMATQHLDARCREAAVSALGAIGHLGGLASVLSALEDRPPIRRRAVVALAGFNAPEVEEALRRCLGDPDWQVRQGAEVLLDATADSVVGVRKERA